MSEYVVRVTLIERFEADDDIEADIIIENKYFAEGYYDHEISQVGGEVRMLRADDVQASLSAWRRELQDVNDVLMRWAGAHRNDGETSAQWLRRLIREKRTESK